MLGIRKPIAFDTTLRNPYRIPGFIKIFKDYEGQILTSERIIEIEARLIREKLFEPTSKTLMTYRRFHNGKFHFVAEDQSDGAAERVRNLYNEWKDNDPGYMDLESIKYLLKNTVTDHKDHWKGGWETRLWTQCKFMNELGLVYMEKDQQLRISDTAKLMLVDYEEGTEGSTNVQSAFLSAFAKYQTNNPFRKNTVKVNFFPLVLNVIKYLKENYQRPGLYYQDISFVIAWDSNDYVQLAEYIQSFRDHFHYNDVADEQIYRYAMNLLDGGTPNDVVAEASREFIDRKRKHYKFRQLIHETRDEVIRKLRMTRLISFRGAGKFIDFNDLESEKIDYVIDRYSDNIGTFESVDSYFQYMGSVDQALVFDAEEEESEETVSAKERALSDYAEQHSWDFLKEQMGKITSNSETRDQLLRFIDARTRLEFLCAVIVKKKLPNTVVRPNYIADDQGIPISTATGQHGNSVGADIDIYENNIHAIMEPTKSSARSFQVEHEVPSILNHVFGTKRQDEEEENPYTEWFAVFIAPHLARDVADEVAAKRLINHVEIYPWNADDFVEYTIDNNINSIGDYKIIRDYMQPRVL